MKHILAILSTSVILLASCGGNKTGNSAEDLAKLKSDRAALDQKIAKLDTLGKDSAKKAPVTIMTVQPTKFTGFIDVQSQVSGDDNVFATSKASGTVNNVLVHSGQNVRKGQLLATLDANTVEQQINGLQPQLTLAKTLYEKQQKLWAEEIGTEVQLLQAKAQYDGLLKQKASLESQHDLYRIVAPIDGTVDVVSLKVGDVASPGSLSGNGILINNFSKLKVEANLGESYLGKVKIGDPVTIVFPDINDSIKTTLTYVTQTVNSVSRAFTVQVRLGSNNKLHPNMSCKMHIANYENGNVIVVPVNLVQRTAEGDIVYTAVNGVAKATKVTLGRNSNGQTEVLSGLNAGDKLITAGFENLDNNSPIAVQ